MWTVICPFNIEVNAGSFHYKGEFSDIFFIFKLTFFVVLFIFSNLLTVQICINGLRYLNCPHFPYYILKLSCLTKLVDKIVMKIYHYENTPIQIYWNFHLQKQKMFRQKIWYFFHISAQKHRLWILVRTASASIHNLCFWAEVRKISIPL